MTNTGRDPCVTLKTNSNYTHEAQNMTVTVTTARPITFSHECDISAAGLVLWHTDFFDLFMSNRLNIWAGETVYLR